MEERVPEIRFKGFEELWEKCTLGDVGKARSGIGFPDSEQGGKMGMPFYKVSDMNILGNETEMINANNYVTEVQIIRNGWSPIEAVPAIIFAKVGAAVMLNRKRLCRTPFLLDNNTMAYSLDESKWDAEFAKALFANVDLTALVQVGALPSYNASDVEGIEISLASLIEQKQIGRYFKELDNQIYLSQQKLDQLKTFKKACLEKMFPKEGETVPEIRFKGFEGPWERMKLKELAIFNPKGDIPNAFEYVDLESVSGTEMLSHRTEYKATAPSRAQRLAKYGDLFFQMVRPYQKNNYLFEKTNTNYVFSTGYAQIRPFIDGYFLLSLVQKEEFVKVVLDKCTGTSYPAINSKDLSDIDVYFPYEKQEQRLLGNYFRKIDILISLQQQKMDKLKALKKAFLDKMFV